MNEIFREISYRRDRRLPDRECSGCSRAAAGCTVIICESGAAGRRRRERRRWRASRETDLLAIRQKACQEVYGVLLSGGSAFGLDAAGGS